MSSVLTDKIVVGPTYYDLFPDQILLGIIPMGDIYNWSIKKNSEKLIHNWFDVILLV
jgi:hypothetical protein